MKIKKNILDQATNSSLWLNRMIDPDLYRTEVEPDLDRFGERVAKEIWDLGRRCELEPPYLKPSPWGTR